MKKLIIAFILLLGIVFIIGRFTEVQQIALILREGNFWYIGLAVLVELAWILTMGASFQVLFGIVGIRQRWIELSRLAIAVNFVNLVAPSAGVSGMAVFISHGQQNGHSTAKITIGSVLFLLFDYIGLLVIIFAGLIILGIHNTLHITEIIAFVLFLALAAGLTSLLVLAARSKEKLAIVLTWLAKTINRLAKPFLHREPFQIEKAGELACEASEGISTLRHVRLGWIKPLLLTFTNKALLITVLGLMFLAFNAEVTIPKLIAGFGIAYLFVIISPTPAGVGIVEGVLTISLTTLDVPLESAAIITLAFRGITFWLPLFIGMVSFRTLRKM